MIKRFVKRVFVWWKLNLIILGCFSFLAGFGHSPKYYPPIIAVSHFAKVFSLQNFVSYSIVLWLPTYGLLCLPTCAYNAYMLAWYPMPSWSLGLLRMSPLSSMSCLNLLCLLGLLYVYRQPCMVFFDLLWLPGLLWGPVYYTSVVCHALSNYSMYVYLAIYVVSYTYIGFV